MNKRQFLAAAGASLALPLAHATKPAKSRGPTLLTLSGAISRHNRGPLDPALDQMMHKQKVSFDAAYTFDYDALLALPAISIKPTLEYDGKPHRLDGPLLSTVLMAVGANTAASTTVFLRAIDGYTVAPTMADIQHDQFILATHIDGAPLPLGGLGPLWAVYDADRIPDLAQKPLAERFGLCPWGIYHIEIKAA